jgi:tellurite resistance-related uncharacterized protein
MTMATSRLPAGLAPKGSSSTFTEATVPEALREEHALTAGHWGVLQVLDGRVFYVDIGSGEERQVTAPDLVIIVPETPHKLRLDGGLSCRIDFFQDIRGERTARAREIAAHDAVRRSLERCEVVGNFGERFYEVFLGASPDAARHFADTDFERQRDVLRGSVYVMATRDISDPSMRETLERLGESHSRTGRNIPPVLYDSWLDSLCETVASMDPEWTEELGKLWRIRLRDGIQVITAAY